MRSGGIGLRIATIAIAVALVAIAIVGGGVLVIGGEAFAQLMIKMGQDTAVAHEMFEESVSRVLVLAIVVAAAVATMLALIAGSRLGRQVREIGRAARRVADGDLGARVPRRGAEELVEVADAFNQMAAALEESETSRREFIANAAHELRTPLTNLKGFLEGLRDGVFEPDHDTFESLLEETDRLVRLSGSLVQLAEGDAQITPNQPRRMALAPVVRSAVALIRPAAQARNLSVSVGGAEGTAVSADPDRLRQVLANLLNNAVRYSTPGSSVAVHWEQRRDDVLVSVVNTGSAIPTAELPYVFERFFRVEKSRDRTRGGAGIGLAIVRQLVEAAGGHVGAESSNDRTRFWFTVTSAPPEDESVAISSRGAAQATQARTG